MDKDTVTILQKLMASAIYDTGIPIEKKQLLERSQKKNMAAAQKKYINNHQAYQVLDEKWFHEYLQDARSIQGLCRYVLEEESWKWAKRTYIQNLAADVRSYAELRTDGISDLEEMALRNFYRMLLMTMRETMKPLKRGYLLPIRIETMHARPGEAIIFLEDPNDRGRQIYHWLAQRLTEPIPDEMEQYARQYYDLHIEAVDFRKAVIWKTDSKMVYHGEIAEILTLFAERFGYDMPKEKARELLFWSPYYGGSQRNWLPAKYLTEMEIREQVTVNLLSGELKGDVMRWHIRYCMDHGIEECAPVILKVARNPIRNEWVRKDALEYACRLMGIREVCEKLLPGLKGELFFFVAHFFRGAGDRELADLVWDYGEQFPKQKLRTDICLSFMQDRRGVESLRRHLQKRNGMPREWLTPGPAEAVRSIHSVELTDELERLLRVAWKAGFRDDPDESLLHAAAMAMVAIGQKGGQGYKQVMQAFDHLMEWYSKEDEKVSAIKGWMMEIERLKD